VTALHYFLPPCLPLFAFPDARRSVEKEGGKERSEGRRREGTKETNSTIRRATGKKKESTDLGICTDRQLVGGFICLPCLLVMEAFLFHVLRKKRGAACVLVSARECGGVCAVCVQKALLLRIEE